MANEMERPCEQVVLFDGTCNLCNAAVRFVIEHDRAGSFRFATLQSETGARLLRERGHASVLGEAESVLLVQGTKVYSRSDAALRIARCLDGAWPLLHDVIVVPRSIRDAVYRFIARRRYRWLGQTEECQIPSPEHARRFLP